MVAAVAVREDMQGRDLRGRPTGYGVFFLLPFVDRCCDLDQHIKLN
jgi:hypothetical protein